MNGEESFHDAFEAGSGARMPFRRILPAVNPARATMPCVKQTFVAIAVFVAA